MLFAIIILSVQTYAADKNDNIRKKFKQAMRHYNKQDYNLALPIFNELSVKNPENMNLKFLIGMSYFNSDINKNLSVPFLEMASKNIKTDYVNNVKQITAPIHTLYYLGQAYEATGNYQKAIVSYDSFKKYLIAPKLANQIVEVDERINICRNAIKNLELAEANVSVVQQSTQLSNNVSNQTPVFKKVEQAENKIIAANTNAVINKTNETPVQIKVAEQINIAEKKEVVSQELPIQVKQEKAEVKIVQAAKEEPIAEKINTPTVNYNVFAENNFYVQFATGKVKPDAYKSFTENVYVCNGKDGVTRYITGTFSDYDEATTYKNKIIKLGYKDAWLAKRGANYVDCKKIK